MGAMTDYNGIWDQLGSLEKEDAISALVKLFLLYEETLRRDPANQEAQQFMGNLNNVLTQVSECNLNRR
jgi:hypothetical protein